MEKMQTIYKEQPKLGDSDAVAQSLSVCERRLQELGNELEKYKVGGGVGRVNNGRMDKDGLLSVIQY